VAAGVRRIEAAAGLAAENYIQDELSILSSVRKQMKNPKDLSEAIQDLNVDAGAMRKKIDSFEIIQATHLKTQLLEEVIAHDKYFFLGKRCEGVGPDALRKIAGDLRQSNPKLLLALAIVTDAKPFVVVGIGDGVFRDKNLDATKIIKETVAPMIKGGGGGQNILASAGGQDANKLDAVILAVKALL
jgi:alanyl-tRNA synthetase